MAEFESQTPGRPSYKLTWIWRKEVGRVKAKGGVPNISFDGFFV